ncbi:gallate 1-beta-glucosyltransferase-like [Vigna unguiculata]|uniref:Glycosyltransferase n=1 Tax=Vigna unguiculata TaxID=3917 RepID=A0A4D6N8N6_VIGUN|nr:gallate 1-beta-glucosyltransferase-like [Vigna unguiculata]QCE08505.1 sinapate 1-glucosyltransferase [Vigna unguiculata]
MESEAPIHVLMVSYPGQGHINPLLRLAKFLADKGFFVTFSTADAVGKLMRTANDISHKSVTPVGDGFLKFEFFDDGGVTSSDDSKRTLSDFNAQVERSGRQYVSQVIKEHAETNHPVSCIINNPFVPWVCDVAADHGIPSAMLWVQSAASFTAYYSYFHKLVPFPSQADPYHDVKLASVVLKYNEVPDFLHPFSPYQTLGTVILEQFKNLSKPFCVLVDSFEELESDYINYLSEFVNIRPIGPLFKSPTATDTSEIRGDFLKSDDCIEWLNSRAAASVVYISFGSIVCPPQEQVTEIAHGLLESEVSFLWVLKPPTKVFGLPPYVLPDGFLEETREKGKVVQWSPQEEVLGHGSVACFVTHCGWNSSMEGVTLGVPMLTFPAWGDQVTNAKFLVDVYGVAIKLGYGQTEKKIVSREEVKKRLLEATVGPKAEELKKNALRWKMAAEAAVAANGSSAKNLDAFLKDIKKRGAVRVKEI